MVSSFIKDDINKYNVDCSKWNICSWIKHNPYESEDKYSPTDWSVVYSTKLPSEMLDDATFFLYDSGL